MKHSSSFLLLIVFLSLIHVSCKKEPPVVPPEEKLPVYKQSIYLSVADSGLTEIYLKLSITDSLLPRGFSLYRNNSQILSGSLFGKETTLVDTAAQFNSAYTYRAFRMDNSLRKDSSNTVMTKTLDTTSHEFAWTELTFGNKNSSVFYGLAMVNDTTLYALGTIYIGDSIYTIAKYEKGSWSLKKLFYTTETGDTLKLTVVKDLFVRNSNSISLFSASIFEWDGTSTMTRLAYSRFSLPNTDGTIDKSFGANTNDIFGVGRRGSIIHLNGSVWQSQTSGTTVDLTDVWGTADGETVWACGYKYDFSSSVFLKYTTTTKQWQTLWTKGVSSQFPFTYVSSIWGNRKFYIANNTEIYELNGAILKKHSPSFQNFIYRIRGDGENNIAVVASGGNVWHYNGASWKRVFSNSKYSLYSVAVKGKTIVAVGSDDSSFPNKAIVIIGKQ